MPKAVLILVDIAEADSAVALLKQAHATFAHAALHVAYVMPFGFYSYVEPYISEDSQKAAVEKAKADLSDIVARAEMETLVISHVLRGGIGEQALLFAQKIDASVIVLNATRSDSQHTTLGTHAAQIARHAAASVFLMRPDR